MSLIAALTKLQEEHGYLSAQMLGDLAAERNVPLYALQAIVSFYPHFRKTPPAAKRIAVCRDMACHLAGADGLCAKIEQALGDGDDIHIQRVSCLGRCESAPVVSANDVPLGGRDEKKLLAAISNPISGATWHSPKKRRWDVDPYKDEAEHYSLIKKLHAGAPLDIIATLKASNLRGMGGAAFPTGVKWELVANQSEPIKYVICNADESEPGTFKDRVILAQLPHLVIEGVLVAAHMIKAAKAYIFIRHEYEPERRVLVAEIERARKQGLLEACDVEIFTSPGGYILGEETALLECMEDKRGEPRNKPPFPGAVGLHGKPTLINNVETFAAAVAILERGADWWQSIGTNGCTGYKFISVSGHVTDPGVYLIPMGTTVGELIEIAGGVVDGKALKAFAPGGASSNFLPADKADTPLDFTCLGKVGSMLGSGALFVVAEGTDMMALGTNIVRFFRNESCGKCVPCRVGSAKAVELLEQILAEGGRRDQLELLKELAHTMEQTSICGLGQVALNPILSVIKNLPDDVARYVD
jgi:NADH:ubiquinone oxidoreductase subunit F (NADH-binding)/NADH:ubiquinone oxidoreductase subunit E